MMYMYLYMDGWMDVHVVVDVYDRIRSATEKT